MIRCDIGKCVGCKMCEVTCSDGHFGGVSPVLSRIRVAKLEAIGIDMAISCLGCQEQPCLECVTGALSVGTMGQIVVDSDGCNGCGECVEACPVGAIGFHDDEPLFCDLCEGTPSCVATCPTGALTDERDERVSLAPFMKAVGNPAQKRAQYAKVMANPIRKAWESGRRVDS